MAKTNGNFPKSKIFLGRLISVFRKKLDGRKKRSGEREVKGVDTEEELKEEVKKEVEGLTAEGRRAPTAQ